MYIGKVRAIQRVLAGEPMNRVQQYLLFIATATSDNE